MTSRDFVYWLQGFFEISGNPSLTEEQGKVVQKHLQMVFIHEIDPSMPDKNGKLQEAHDKPVKIVTQRPPWDPNVKVRC